MCDCLALLLLLLLLLQLQLLLLLLLLLQFRDDREECFDVEEAEQGRLYISRCIQKVIDCWSGADQPMLGSGKIGENVRKRHRIQY